MPEKSNTGHAVVDVAGKQFRVAVGQELKVPRTAGEAGSRVQLDRVLLLNDGSITHFGNPAVIGASVDATLLRHGRDRKVIVFKFRRRKGYWKKAGHRQGYSILRVDGINLIDTKPHTDAKKRTRPPTTDTPKAEVAPKKAAAAEKPPASRKPATTKKSKDSVKPPSTRKTSTGKKSTGTTKGSVSKTAGKKKAGGS